MGHVKNHCLWIILVLAPFWNINRVHGGALDDARGVVFQPDGKLIVAGSSNSDQSYDFALARYLPNGSLDESFGTKGKVTTDFSGSGSLDVASGIVLQSDGKFIVAGTSNADFALSRYREDGSLDRTFDHDGKVTTNFSGSDIYSESYEEAYALALQKDGKILVGGLTNNTAAEDFALARYHPDGSLDESFGVNGKVTADFSNDIGSAIRSIAVQEDGKIVATGFSEAGGYSENRDSLDFALVRYNMDGSPDLTFGTEGMVVDIVNGSHEEAYSMALQGDGKMLVAGSRSESGFISSPILVRYNANGTLDANFGKGGKVFDESMGAYHAILIQGDLKILAAGFHRVDDESLDFTIARYHPDGSFGLNGRSATHFDSDAIIYSLALGDDDKIVAVGDYIKKSSSEDSAGSSDFALARYQSDGTLDQSFGESGKTTTDFSGGCSLIPN